MKLTAGAYTYEVVMVETCSDPADPTRFGYCIPSRRIIELRYDQSFDHAIETLAHEYGHACEASGIDLDQPDPEKRMVAMAAIAVAFRKEFERAGGDEALAKLLRLDRSAEEIEQATPDIAWDTLTGGELYSAVLRHVYCRRLTDSQFATYRAEIEAKRLNPFLGECYPITDKGSGKVMIGVKLPALRRLCREHGGRIGNYEWAGKDGAWRDVWITPEWGFPMAARCPIVNAHGELVYGIVEWDAYAQFTVIDGTRFPTGFWERMGAHMLALCAERQAIGRVIPAMSNVVIAEEMMYRGGRKGVGGTRSLDPTPAPLAADDQRPDVNNDDVAGAIGSMDELRAALKRRGCGHDIVAVAIINKVEKASPGLREENEQAFYAAVLKHWETTKGR